MCPQRARALPLIRQMPKISCWNPHWRYKGRVRGRFPGLLWILLVGCTFEPPAVTQNQDGGGDAATPPRDGGPDEDAGTDIDAGPAGSPAALTFVSPRRTVEAGACSDELLLGLQDAEARMTTADADAPVELVAAPGSGILFFADAGCTTTITSITIIRGAADARFFVSSQRAGTHELWASAAGLAGATQTAEILPAAPETLAFTSAPQTVTAGACSQAVTVEQRDGFGNPSADTVAAQVNLRSVPADDLAFFSDAGCTMPIDLVEIPAGQTSTDFFFSGTTAGTVNLEVSGPGFVGVATQTETIIPGGPTSLEIGSPPQALQAGACSAPLTIRLVDGLGNAIAGGVAVDVGLTASPSGGFAFYADAGCSSAITATTIAGGASEVSVYFAGTVEASVTVTVSSNGLNPNSQVQTITAGPPSSLRVVTPPQTLTAGACSNGVGVEVRDGNGNATPLATTLTVDLSAAPPAQFSFYSDPGCTASVTSVEVLAGTSSTSFYFRGRRAGPVDVTVSAIGVSADVQTETIQPAPASALSFVTPGQNVLAGVCSNVVAAEARDSFGNVATVLAARTVELSATPETGFTFYGDAGCTTPITSVTIPAGGSRANFYFSGSQAGAVQVTAQVAVLSSATQVELIVPNVAEVLAFASSPQTVTAGDCSQPLTIQTRDAFANGTNVTSDLTVTLFASPSAGFTFYSDAGCTNAVTDVTVAAGTSEVDLYFAGDVAANVTIIAVANDFNDASQVAVVVPGPPAAVVFVTPPQIIEAGTCSGALTVERRDAFGNAAAPPVASVVDLAAAPAAGFTFYTDSACANATTDITILAGQSRATAWFTGQVATAHTVTGSSPPLSPAQQVESIFAAPAEMLSIVTPPHTVQADVCSPLVTVETQDQFGNPASTGGNITVTVSADDPTVSFHTNAACNAAVTTVSIPAGVQSGDVRFLGTNAGTFDLTVSAPGFSSDTQSETITAGPPATLVFTTAPQTVTAGDCSGAVTLESRDGFGNPSNVAADTSVTLAAAPSLGFTFYSDAGCTVPVSSADILSGQSSTTFFFAGESAGDVDVSASAAGFGAAQQTETVQAAAASALTFVTAPQITTAGACSGVVTIETTDAFDNVSAVAAATTVSLDAVPAAGFTFYADAGCGTPVSEVVFGAGTSQQSFYFSGTNAGGVEVTASSAGFTAGNQQQTITPDAPSTLAFVTSSQTVTSGVCSAVATIETRDQYGNPSDVAAATTINLTAAPDLGFTFFSDASCNSAVTSIAVQNGGRQADFYFSGTMAGLVQVTARVTGYTNDARQSETITAAAPTQLVFTTAPQSVAEGTCSGVVGLQSQDTFGNPSNVAQSETITLSAQPAAGFTFYGNAGCTNTITTRTISPGASSTSFHFMGANAGTVTITAASGFAPDVMQDETVTAACTSGCSPCTNFGCCTDTCPGGDCTLTCNDDCACDGDCAQTTGTCTLDCRNRAACTFDCEAVNTCTGTCRNDSTCFVDCRQANNCDFECRDSAVCNIDCTGANNCDTLDCRGNAQCTCTGVGCQFDRCAGGLTSCPNDVVVCNTACP